MPPATPFPWHPRRLAAAAAVWGALSLIEMAVVVASTPDADGPGLSRLLLFYGALAALWTALTPLAAWWERRAERPERSAVAGIGVVLVGIAVTGALDTATRRGVLFAFGMPAWRPFWATWLYLLDVTAAQYCAVLLATRVLEAHDALVARARVELTLRAQLARSRLTHLEAQLQPHFLFNALGTISELAHEAPAAAARMLRQLAALLRHAVERTGEEVTLDEELATLEPYLEIQRMRFADWLRIEQLVSPNARPVRVPRLVLQPLVENAIKHGLVGRSERGRIEIIARVEDDRLVVVVRDNGAGLRPREGAPDGAPGYGIGLRNVRERLATLYGDAWRLSLDSAPGGGAAVTLSIPARRAALPAPTDGAAVPSLGPGRVLDFIRRHPAAATVVGWFLLGSAWLGQSGAYLLLRGRTAEAALPRQLVTHFTGAALWAVATPLVGWLAARVPLQRHGAAWRVPLHLALATAVAFGHALVWRALLGRLLAADAPPWPAAYVSTIFVSVLAYLIVLGVGHHGRAIQWLRERETTEAALRAELEESALDEATLRTRPDALVRTLEELADDVDGGVAGTEQAIAELADGLRENLDGRRTTLAAT